MKNSSVDKIIEFNEVQNHLTEGIKLIYNLLYETYGPNGRNILIDSTKTSNLELCQQGSKIASKLKTRDIKKNLVILLLQDSFQKINNVSGDGSKTFFLISSSLILNGFKHITNSVDMSQIYQGIQHTLEYSLNLLSEKTEPIRNEKTWDKTLLQFMPQEDNINFMIKTIFQTIGKSGRIKLDSIPGQKSSVEIEYGLQLNRGYFSPYFITDTNKMLVNFENPYVLITKQKFSSLESELIKILELLIHANRPLLIISPDIDDEALSTLIMNKINGIVDVAYVKLPIIFGSDSNQLDDLAVYTGAKIIENYTQWKLFSINDLGEAKKVVLTKTKTTIWGDPNKNSQIIKGRSEAIKTQIIETNSTYENEKLEDRYKNFNASSAILRVGGITDLETDELRSRVESGLTQVKGCLYEGILSGGVLNYALIIEEIENWARTNLQGPSLLGSKLVIHAFLKPMQTLLNSRRFYNNVLVYDGEHKNSQQIYKQQMVDYGMIKNNISNSLEKNIVESFKNIKIQLQTTSSLTYSLLSIGHFVL